MNTFKRLTMVLALVVALGAGAGCAKKQTGADLAPVESSDNNSAASAAIERAAQTISDGIVYFDFDKFDIKGDYRDMLRQKAELMKAYPSIRVRVEGNCDARGTQEYNLALGERRARATYEYMVMLGVNPAQLEMISFGKERPAVEGTGPAVWSKNRRDDFRVIAK
ncbi:MAG: peptidoglycan-associated lipoprotein Pal [Bilophila sp.]